MERRGFLAAVGATAVAGCTGSGGSDGEPEEDGYGNWFGDVDNFDGEIDRTGQDRTRVLVGAGDGLAFEPAAIVVAPETTVVWEWTGNGGGHNVVEIDGAFESSLVAEAGHTFEHSFADRGLYPYFCTPHRDEGMKGGVRVRMP